MLLSLCFLSNFSSTVQAKEKPTAQEEDTDEEITYPLPDLKIVKKYFKLVKYAYDDVKEQLVMTVVPLTDSVPARFIVKHYDAAGEHIDYDITLHYYNAKLGEPITCKVGLAKKFMDRAKKAVISRP